MTLILARVCDWCGRKIPDEEQWFTRLNAFDFCSVQCMDRWERAGKPNPDFTIQKRKETSESRRHC